MADISVPRWGFGAAASAPASSIGAWLAASAAMIAVLIAPALWNGFPLIFPDTGGYLMRPIEGTLAMGRSALYGLFLYLSVPFAFWPVIVVQAAATAWVIMLSLRCHGLGGRPWLALGITSALAAFTSLPWFAAQLMPDIFFPLAVLALHLLAFRPCALRPAERLGLIALIAVTMASHMAALGLCLCLIALLWLSSRFKIAGMRRFEGRYAVGAVAGGLALSLLANAAITGTFAFTPGGSSFLFARLIEDGIAQRYLNEHCPNPRLHVCAYADVMPKSADDWLWENDTPFYKLGGPEGFGPEATRIVAASIRAYPLMHLEAALTDTVEQLLSFQTDVSIDDNDPTFDAIRDHAPALLPAFLNARQQAQRFDVAPLNLVHVPATALAIAWLIGALIWRRRLKLAPDITALALSVLLALLANAAICGVFSHPVDRYQSRLVPLASLAVVMLIARRGRGHPRLEASPA